MRAFLDGVALEEASGAGWSYVPGTAPHVRTLEVDAGVAAGLFARSSVHGSTLRLDCTAEGLGIENVKKLTILGIGPTSIVGTATLVLADRRWVLGRTWVRRSYNVPRRTGARRRLPGVPLAVAPIADDLFFHRWSLENEDRRWAGKAVLADVLDLTAGAGEWRDESGRDFLSPVQDLELDEPGDAALGRTLAYFGLALQVWVDADGTYVLYDRLSGGERELVGAPPAGGPAGGGSSTAANRSAAGIGKPFENTRRWRVQDRKRERPSKILVHSVRAVELRVDLIETTTSTAEDGDVGEAGGRPPRMDYVVALPEDRTIDGAQLVQGTYAELFAYVSSLAGQEPAGLPPLSPALLRMSYLSPLLLTYSQPGVDLTGIWARRVRVIHDSYRRRLRLRRLWLDRVRSIRPYRVALLDTETGGRGPATVYADFAEWSHWRWLEAVRLSQPANLHQPVRNRYANPARATGGGIVGTPIEDLVPAPAHVAVEDEDQGVLFLDYATDYTGQVSVIIPTALEVDSLPSDDPTRRNQWLAYGNATPTHEISVVVTVGMGAPNDLRQFHTEEVLPSDVEGLLGSPVGAADGPELHIRVEPGLSIARQGWDDSKADAFYRAWGPGGGDLTDVLGDPINKDEVRDVALAIGARVYSSYQDHVEGGLETAFAGGRAKIAGTVARVSHEFAPGRGAVTILELPGQPPARSDNSFLSVATRKIVLREVE